MKLGLIAGNGRFPFLLLDAARAHGTEVVVAAIKEETDPEIDVRAAADPGIHVYWLSLGELSRLIDTFHKEGVTQAIMAGQVKHKQIFSSIRPDWRLAKLLMSLRTKNTDMLLGAVAKVLGDEGIELIPSTSYLEPLLAAPGVLTSRAPSDQEQKDIAYGREVALAIAGFDLGQTVVVASQACVAVEAMEGTDKVAKPKQDMRFDVPVIGARTIDTMRGAHATCLAIEAHRTLVFDRDKVIELADRAGIAIVAIEHQ
jgi:DUF1009 family protein